MAKTLKECLNYLGMECEHEQIINKVTTDSRECDEHSIYVGHRYAKDALDRKAWVVEEKYLRSLFNYFYEDPSQHYFVIGVTGTNGKTSVTHYLKELLTSYGIRCIRLGSHQNEFEDKNETSINTTMDIMKNLDVFLKYKNYIDCIIMEVSSIAIEENRINFISFDRIIYTNLSVDHLDYHITFIQYMYSKFKLRNFLKKDGKILLNYNDSHLRRMLELERIHILFYRTNQLEVIHQSLHQLDFQMEDSHFSTNMLGDFVLVNLCAALTCIKSMGLDLNSCRYAVEKMKNVDGRMDMFEHLERIFVIDYAHTPHSLELACQYLNRYKTRQLFVVFGCGGDRDRQKREYMANVACQQADRVIVCEDNNRNESFLQIVEDMKLERFFNVVVIEKRKNALKCALTQTQKHDIILVAGKGNEQFLFTGGSKIPYNDKEFIMSL